MYYARGIIECVAEKVRRIFFENVLTDAVSHQAWTAQFCPD